MDKNGLERERKLGRKTRQHTTKRTKWNDKRSEGKMQENPQKNEVDIQFGHACTTYNILYHCMLRGSGYWIRFIRQCSSERNIAHAKKTTADEPSMYVCVLSIK